MARRLEQIAAEALELPEKARAKLVERLLRSFPVAAAMDRGAESGAPAHEVLRRIERRRE